MMLTWLADVLRAAGLTVHGVGGWRTRGSSTFDPRGLICHATAGSRTSTDAGEIRVLLTGSSSAPPPIAQLYLGRNGHWHVIAAGRCNHARVGWAGPLKGLGNTNLIGVEAANDNRGEPWPAVQLDSYQRGVAAICRHMGWTASRVAGHKEHQPWPPPPGQTSTKSDPHGIDMRAFRSRVTALLEGEDDTMSEKAEEQIAEIHAWMKSTGMADSHRLLALLEGRPVADYQLPGEKTRRSEANQLAAQLAAVRAELVALAGRDLVDEPAIVAGVLEQLSPAAIAAAIPPALTRQVADELARRMVSEPS